MLNRNRAFFRNALFYNKRGLYYHVNKYKYIYQNKMKIKIQGQELNLHYTFRMHVIYENITGESIDFTNMTSMKQISSMLLACILSSAKKENKDIDITYDAYMDWLDENGGYIILNKFALWLADELKAKYEILSEETEKEEDFPDISKKGKN